MKIFSLKSRWSLAGWSTVLGILTGYLVNKLSFIPDACNSYGVATGIPNFCLPNMGSYGFPIRLYQGYETFPESGHWNNLLAFSNFIFWILAVLIILSLLKYFKIRKELGSSK